MPHGQLRSPRLIYHPLERLAESPETANRMDMRNETTPQPPRE